MNLALVNLAREEDEPPLGLAYLAAYLREHAGFHHTVIIDEDHPLEALRVHRPDLVGIAALSFLFPEANRLAGAIKSEFRIPVIVGGYHISTLPHHLAPSHFDVGVIGEGEQTLAELVSLFERQGAFPPADLRKIPGLVFRNERGESERTEPRPLIEPLDRIPVPARDLLQMKERYHLPRKGGFAKLGVYSAMLTSRGCPFTCTFCSPRLFWRKFRAFSAGRVVDEMELLARDYGVDGIMIWDDLFVVDRKRLGAIADLADDRPALRRIPLFVFARGNLIREETMPLLRRLRVASVFFGLESGSERILHYLKKGAITTADNLRALRLCRQHGIHTIGTLIIGSPDETEEDLAQTLALVRHPDLDEVVLCHLTPLPGTEIWEDAKREGLVSEDFGWPYESLSGWAFHPGLVMTKHLSAEQLRRWHGVILREAERKRARARLKSISLKYLFHPHVLRRAAVRAGQYLHAFRHRLRRPQR